MAEGESCVDAGRHRQCNICEESGLRRSAEKFCLNCKQSLCNDYLALHKIMATTRLHDIRSIDELLITTVDDQTDHGTSWNVTCDICKERGQNISAPFSCLQCEQNFCESCRQYHMRVKATRLHEIIEKSTTVIDPDSSETTVCKEHDCAYEYFCKQDMTVLCPGCRQREHGDCDSVTSVGEAAKNFYSISTCQRIIQELTSRTKEITAHNEVTKAKSNVLKTEKETLRDKLRRIRISFDALLDKLEAKAVDELNGTMDSKLNKMLDKVRENEVKIDSLKKNTSDMRNAMSKYGDEERLIAASIVEHENKNLLEKDQSETTGTDEDEIQRNYISDLRECTGFLQNLSEIDIYVSMSLTESKTTMNSNLQMSSRQDEESPEILSYAELENENTTILDLMNDITAYGIAFHSMKR